MNEKIEKTTFPIFKKNPFLAQFLHPDIENDTTRK